MAATKSGWSDYRAIDFVKEVKEMTATEKHPWQLAVVGADLAEQQRFKVVDLNNAIINDQNYVHDPEEHGMLTQI